MAVEKRILYPFVGLTVLLVGALVWWLVSLFSQRAGDEASGASVTVTIPDAEVKEMADSKSEAMRGAVTLDKYFGELPPDGGEEMSLVSGSPASSAASSSAPVASGDEAAVARVFGSASPGEAPSSSSSPSHRGGGGRSRSGSSAMSAEERLAYDRQRAEMVRDVLAGGTAPEEAPDAGETVAAAPALDLSAVGDSDGIISSLDDDFSDDAVQYEGAKRPFRCMFVRDQKLVSGQRVSLRLLEDYVADGVRIPANTHLSAICKIGERLELSVRSLELGGRIVPLALDAYDTDGMPGIYCPETASSIAAVLSVPEAHVLKPDAPRAGGKEPLLRSQDLLRRLRLEHLVDAVGGGAGLAHGHEDAGEAHDHLGDHVEIGEEGQDDPRLQGAPVHPPGSEEHHQGQADVQAELHEGAGDGHDGAGLDVRIRHLPVGGGEPAHFVPGLGQGLHHPDAGDVLPHDAHQHVQLLLDPGEQGDAPGGNGDHHQDKRVK